MKKLILTFVLSLSVVFLNYGQSWKRNPLNPSEANKAMGIAPNDNHQIQYKFVKGIPSDTILFTSYYNETRYYYDGINYDITHNPGASFKFDGRIVTTTMTNQMKKIRIYNIANKGKDSNHSWINFECKDNSGSIMYLIVAQEFQKKDTIDLLMLDYNNTVLIFEVEKEEIPEEPYSILDNIEELGYFDDGNFGSDYTDEEVKEFLKIFGDPKIIITFMLKDLFYNQDFTEPKKWQKQYFDYNQESKVYRKRF